MTPTKEQANRIISRLAFVGIAGNILLTAFKLFAGIAGNSSAMISDSVHSLSDVFATFIAWLGALISRKPQDEDHPYGHERFECVASLILGLILLLTGAGIGFEALGKIFRADALHAEAGTIALVAAIVSIAVKESMYHYTLHYARMLNSAVFTADAWHHRSDAFSSIGALAGIIGSRMGYPVLDSVASAIICGMIIWTAYGILKDSITKIVDTSCGEKYESKLKDFINAQAGVLGIKTMHSRLFSEKVFVDVSILVDGDQTLRKATAIADAVHHEVEKEFLEVKHIMIHIHPAEKE